MLQAWTMLPVQHHERLLHQEERGALHTRWFSDCNTSSSAVAMSFFSLMSSPPGSIPLCASAWAFLLRPAALCTPQLSDCGSVQVPLRTLSGLGA